jgi:hypothetical protein
MQFPPISCHIIPLWSKYSPQHPVLKHPQWAKINTDRECCTLKRNASKNHSTTSAQVMGRQNWIFILKTLFVQKLSDVSFRNPISMVDLQLLNLWLLEVMLRCINCGVKTSDNYKHMTCPSHYSLSQEEFTFWEHPRNPTIGNPWFQQRKHRGGSVLVWAAI